MVEFKKIANLASAYNVLYVEDDDLLRKNIDIYLKKLFHTVYTASNGIEAFELYKINKIDLVLTDIKMPKMDGLELSKKIKQINENQNIIIVSAYSDTSNFTQSISLGIDGYILKPIDYNQMNSLLYKILLKIKNYQENEKYKIELESIVLDKIKETTQLQEEKLENYKKTLYALVDIIESRDTYTGGHSQRVAHYSKNIAIEMGMSEDKCDLIYEAGILHDIGKISIPDNILLKPSSLNELEYKLIQEHVQIGYNMLKNIPMFVEIADIVLAHHERFDGSGYPNNLMGNDIKIESQIMAIADTFDAMTTNRIYKTRKSVKEAILEIKSLSNIWFTKEIVDVAVKVFKNVKIDEHINQFPINSLEAERFAYFYKDQVTGAYNQNYLELMLSRNHYDNKYTDMYIFNIHNFTDYNKKYGWESGDNFLKRLAKLLIVLDKDILVFRIHGDDFVCLCKSVLNIDETIFLDLEEFDSSLMEIKFTHINIKELEIKNYKDLARLNI